MTEPRQPIDIGTEKIPKTLSILPLFDTVLFPKMVLPFVVMQKNSIQLIDDAMSKDRIIGFVASKQSGSLEVKAEPREESKDDLYSVGTSALILKMAKAENNKVQLLVQGLERFRIKEYTQTDPYLLANVVHIKDEEKTDKEIEALKTNISGLFIRIVQLSPGLPQELGLMAQSIQEAGVFADMVSSIINSTQDEKQKILETNDIKKRLKEVARLVNHQIEILELGNKIQTQVKGDMDKSQREYYLRQQLKAIKEELGEKDASSVEIDEYKAKIKKIKDIAMFEAIIE